METRKRKAAESFISTCANVEKASSSYLSDFEGFHSAFSVAITSQLLQLCKRDEMKIPTRACEGTARKQTVCYHTTMNELTKDQWDKLDRNVQLLKMSDRKIKKGGQTNIKFNDQTYDTTGNPTFSDVFGAGKRPAILCCCDGFKSLLQMPVMIPKGDTPCDLLSGGTIYTPLHVDEGIYIDLLFRFVIYFSGGTSRNQIIVTKDTCKIHIIANERSVLFQDKMRDNLINWKDEEGKVDVEEEMTWILDHNEEFTFFLNKYREEMQHCGASYHAVLTLLKVEDSLCLTIGYRSSNTEAVRNFIKTTPTAEKCFHVAGKLVPAQDVSKWEKSAARTARGTNFAKIKQSEENRRKGHVQRKMGKNTGRFGPYRPNKS